MPANLGNPSDSFAPPCRHSRESGNPVPLPALDRKAESRWVPAFAGMTIKVDQANPELEFRTPAPSPKTPPPTTPPPHPKPTTTPNPPKKPPTRTLKTRHLFPPTSLPLPSRPSPRHGTTVHNQRRQIRSTQLNLTSTAPNS